MKKRYEQPKVLAIMLEETEMLALSTPIGEDAQGPACAPRYEEEYEW